MAGGGMFGGAGAFWATRALEVVKQRRERKESGEAQRREEAIRLDLETVGKRVDEEKGAWVFEEEDEMASDPAALRSWPSDPATPMAASG